MPQTMTIDRIGGLVARKITPSFSKEFAVNPTPGGISQATFNTVGVPGVTIDGYSTAASSIQALREIDQNPDWSWSYVQFPTRENAYDGYYHISNIDTHRPPGVGEYLFRISLAKIADRDEVRQAVNWTSASESASGFTSPSAVKMIALPNGAASPTWTSTCRLAQGGSSAILIDPTRDIATLQMPATPATWYVAECQVFDTETAGNATETGWARVLGSAHKFGGDWVMQNGLIRYIASGSVGTVYVWDNVSSPSAWATVGQLTTELTGASPAYIKQIELTRITPDEIRWREIRQYGSNPLLLSFTLRRGAYHWRCKLQTFSGAIGAGNNVRYSASATSSSVFLHIFNTGASGHAASGNLPAQTVDNWFAAYSNSASAEWCAGFVLCDSPTQQPLDTAASTLAQSNIWGTSGSRIFFGFAFPAANACTLVGLRATAASIAAQCMFNVEQSQTLVKRGWHV